MSLARRAGALDPQQDSRLCEGKDILPAGRAAGQLKRAPYSWQRIERHMDYTNSQMKLDQLIGYFNEKKINLIPPFQRGRVWKLPTRKRLIQNIVAGRPIPAIFLYKEPDGSKYTYNILDGKQRLESLLMFIGSGRTDVHIENVGNYFYSKNDKNSINFPIKIEEKNKSFKELSEAVVRDFREYAIPTIEINLDDATTLDEIINLFVDINQQGEKVKRFDIIKAIGRENKLLLSVLDMIAEQQKRKEDILLKKKHTAFTRVLQMLQIVQNAEAANQKEDRMWERLVELVLFCRTGKHRSPGQILKSFIRSRDDAEKAKINPAELKRLRIVFNFLVESYKQTDLEKTRLAQDTPHFYTMVTSLMASGKLEPKGGIMPDAKELRRKLLAFAKFLPDGAAVPEDKYLAEILEKYKQAAARQTTNPGQREIRQTNFLAMIDKL